MPICWPVPIHARCPGLQRWPMFQLFWKRTLPTWLSGGKTKWVTRSTRWIWGTKGGQNHKNPLKISREEKWSWKRGRCCSRTFWTYREDQSDEGVHGHYNPCTRGGQQGCGRSDQPFEGSQWTGLEIGGAWWGSSRSWIWWWNRFIGWWGDTPLETGINRGDQERGAGHCGARAWSYSALSEPCKWNPLVGGTGGTNCASSRFGGIGIHHHLVPCRMCGEASTTGKHRMLVKVRVSCGSKGPRSGSDHWDWAHGDGKENQPSAHIGRAHGEDQEVVGITISGNTGQNLEFHAGSRWRRSANEPWFTMEPAQKKETAHLKRGYSPPFCWRKGEGMAKESHQWDWSHHFGYQWRSKSRSTQSWNMELPLETCEPGKTSGYHRGTSLSDGQPIEAETTGTKTIARTFPWPVWSTRIDRPGEELGWFRCSTAAETSWPVHKVWRMPRASSCENRFPLGEPTRSVDVRSTSSRRRKSKLLGMAGVNAAAPLPRNGFGILWSRVLWALTTETDHVPHKPGGHERLGRSTQHQALRGPAKGHQGPLPSVVHLGGMGTGIEGCHPRSTSPTSQTGRWWNCGWRATFGQDDVRGSLGGPYSSRPSTV